MSALPARLTWAAREVATALGLTRRQFRERRQALQAARFPSPLPGLPNRYDPQAITRWLATLRGEALPS